MHIISFPCGLVWEFPYYYFKVEVCLICKWVGLGVLRKIFDVMMNVSSPAFGPAETLDMV